MGLFDRARFGDQSALARIATLIENEDSDALAMLDSLALPERRVHVLGITGPPGAGKSTLINGLLTELRSLGKIAVLLVDPSSQTSGGAVLGDRVRMLSWGDEGVFIRSQATRGQEGGLAPSTSALIDLFAHMQFDLVLVETVGVGQDGIDIRSVCDTSIVVQSPHLGDSVQALKAGILEIADIFVVTKSDLPGAHQVVRDLNAMIHFAEASADGWSIPVVAVSASENEGLDELERTISAHRRHVSDHSLQTNRKRRTRWETVKRANALISRAARQEENGLWSGSMSRRERANALLRLAAGDLRPPD